MKRNNLLRLASHGFLLLSALSLLSVSIMAFMDPQSVMDLVGVKLYNTDAYSSVRGVYGGVGLTLVISIICLMRSNVQQGLAFLGLLWGMYALSRGITMAVEGPLGAFGKQWMVIEIIFCSIAVVLLLLNQSNNEKA